MSRVESTRAEKGGEKRGKGETRKSSFLFEKKIHIYIYNMIKKKTKQSYKPLSH